MSVAHLLQRHPPAFSSRENAFQFKFGLRFLRLTCVWGTNFQLFCLQSLRPIILNQTIDPIIIGAVNPYQRRPLTWLRRENIFWFKLVLDSSAIRAFDAKNFQVVSHQSPRHSFPERWNILLGNHWCCTSVPTSSISLVTLRECFPILFWS